MIARDYITEWRAHAPWVADAQVEQDMVISRALVAIYADPELARRLAFRGGTALFKLHLTPAARYSEDIDLVQITPGPIGEVLGALRAVLDPWLGPPRFTHADHCVKLTYRFDSEELPSRQMKLKVEINSREHFTELGHIRAPFAIHSRWWAGSADITTFELDEMLGTKLRALYQRRKGRDIFDLWFALTRSSASPQRIVACFERYMREAGHRVSRVMFEKNLRDKLSQALFRADMTPLLRPGVEWDVDRAGDVVMAQLIERLP